MLNVTLDINGDPIHRIEIANVGGDLNGWSDYEVSLDGEPPVEVSHWRPDGALRLVRQSFFALGVIKGRKDSEDG